MSTRRTAKADCHESWCPIEHTLGVIGGVWKVIIIRELLTGTKRYNQLHRALGGVTHKMLTQQLRELERDGVLHREVYKQVPPKVEYSLSELGTRLAPILQAMHGWGLEQLVEASDDGRPIGPANAGAPEPLAVEAVSA
jgi:DNA-binding HxlR family transcriptional regulator